MGRAVGSVHLKFFETPSGEIFPCYHEPMTTCMVLVCDRESRVKGMCQAHYMKMRQRGETAEDALSYTAVGQGSWAARGVRCTWPDGCDEIALKALMCDKHYSRTRYHAVTKVTEQSAYVYLLSAPGWSPEGVMKIGRGTDAARQRGSRVGKVDSRLQTLRCALPTAEFVRRVDCTTSKALEAWLHKQFSDRHVAGEWFRITPEEFDDALARWTV